MSFLVFLAPKTAYPVDVTLTWSANTETDLAGYRIYHREEGQAYDHNYPLWEGIDTTCTIYNLDDSAAHYFVARAFDIYWNESEDSVEVSLQASVNMPPTADAGPDHTADEGIRVALNGSNSADPDGTLVSYSWAQIGGVAVTLSDAASAQPSFTAPYVSLTGDALTFELTVQDDGGLADTDTVIINVSNVNQAPTADAGPDQTVEESSTVTLDGSHSWDADGTVVSYSWTQIGGVGVTLSDAASAQPSFTAPYVSLTGDALTFELTVQDDGGLADTDTVIINVSNVNQAPTADAGPDQTVEESSTVTLDGSHSWDADGTVVSYSWTQIGGVAVTLSETWAAQPNFTAPDVGSEWILLTFQVTVTDDGGLQSQDTCIVQVAPLDIESPGSALYVSGVTIELRQMGRLRRSRRHSNYEARAYLVVLDEFGMLVSGASIRGDWAINGVSLNASFGTTTGAGEARLDSNRLKAESGDTFTLTVTEITKDGYTYDPYGNTHSITVP